MSSLDRKFWSLFKKGEIDYLKLMGKSVVVGAETIEVLQYDSAGKILVCRGTTTPTNGTTGYAKGAIFIKTDAGAGITGFYTNRGTITSCTFAAESAATLPGDITLTTGSVIAGVAGVGAELAIAVQSVPGRAAGALANLAVAEARVLGRITGGNLSAVQILNEHIDAAAAIVLSKLATQAANTILVNATVGVAVPTAVALGTNEILARAAANIVAVAVAENRVLGRVTGGNLGAILVAGSMIDPNAAISLTQLATQAANTILANATAGAAVPTAVAMGAQSALIRAAGNIEALTIAANRVLGRLTAGNVAAIQITAAEIDAAAAIALTQLADQAALTFLVNATNAAGKPTAVALAANQILAVTAGSLIGALAIARKTVLGASATVLTTYALAAGQLLSADANDLLAITVAAGAVVVGATGPAIGSVALATGDILVGQTTATPIALSIAVNEILINEGAGVLNGLVLVRGDLVRGGTATVEKFGAKTVNTIVCGDGSDVISATISGDITVAIAAGDIVTAIGAGKVTPQQVRILTKTVEATDANIVVTAAQHLGGYMEKTNCTVPRLVTTATAALIQAAFNATVGAWFDWTFANQSTQTLTLTAGVGITLKGTAAITTGLSTIVRFVNTGAGTMDAVVVSQV